jgi:hypothetical protein
MEWRRNEAKSVIIVHGPNICVSVNDSGSHKLAPTAELSSAFFACGETIERGLQAFVDRPARRPLLTATMYRLLF